MNDSENIMQGFILPFKERPVLICSENQIFSNKKENLSKFFSVNFKLPYGTEILASKSGVVVSIVNRLDRYYEGDLKDLDHILEKDPFLKFPNYISIQHLDRSISTYSHLDKNSFEVSLGETVSQGQLIAKTGKSGIIGSFPHLHFEVLNYQAMPSDLNSEKFIPKFIDYLGNFDILNTHKYF